MIDPDITSNAGHIVLARAGTGDGVSDCFVDAPGLVFLHGDAVAFVDGARPGIPDGSGCLVCSTSWRRRFPHRAPPPPIGVSTLAVVLARLADGVARIDSRGLGGACCCRAGSGGRTLLEIAFAPATEWQATEALELALAAAALEIDLQVLFSDAGPAHLHGARGRSWRQLTDFGLAELYAEAPGPDAAWEAEARPLTPARATGLRGESRQLILL